MKTPKECQLCERSLEGKPFVDGSTRGGQWAYMCRQCHKDHGVGLGIGRGTLYNNDGTKAKEQK